jgi:hypothetical protein
VRVAQRVIGAIISREVAFVSGGIVHVLSACD